MGEAGELLANLFRSRGVFNVAQEDDGWSHAHELPSEVDDVLLGDQSKVVKQLFGLDVSPEVHQLMTHTHIYIYTYIFC